MSVLDEVLSLALLAAVAVVVVGWIVVQIVGEVLYRRYDRGLPKLRPPGRRARGRAMAGAES